MSYETCESAGEKAIELDQDNRKNGGRGKQNSHKENWVEINSTPLPHKGLQRRMNPNLPALSSV